MTFVEAVKTCFRKYATFRGRAPRSEFWWFMLFNFLVASALSIIGNVIGYQVVGLYQLGVLLPAWGVACRRLHDINRTGWWLIVPSVLAIIWLICMAVAFAGGSEGVAEFGLLCGIAALITAIAILVFYCLAGTPGPNKYGPNPLEDGYQSNDNASNYNDSNYSSFVDLAKSEDSSRTIDLSKY